MRKFVSGFSVACLGIAALATAAFAADYMIPKNVPDYIKSAVMSSERSEQAKERDVHRHPAEVLTMSEVKPGDHVVEFAGFGNYYTTMLSQIVGPEGEVDMFDLPYTEERAGEASRAFVKAHPNTTYTLVNYNDIDLPEDVDEIFMILYYHDLSINGIDVARLNKRIFDALKPGGVFLVVDHNARPGSGREDTKKLHRIDPEVIKKEVTAAGFKLEKESDLLANPKDDHTKMIFRMPERGTTDRTIFKFRKPKG
jgi:predicted methyltransferase